MTQQQSFQKVCDHVYPILEETCACFQYHNITHTKDDVLPACIRIAEQEGISKEDMWLVKTAAVLHDIGYSQRYTDNEVVAADIAADILPQWGYSSDAIKVIRSLILATQMPQSPSTHLEKIMCDADLDSLGRADCFYKGMQVREELNAYVGYIPLKEWFRHQYTFLVSHRYFTAAARTLRDATKKKNIEELKHLIEKTDG